MDLKNIDRIEQAAGFNRSETLRMGLVLLFMIGIVLFTHFNIPDVPNRILLIVAAMIGGYMALNIGANDVANNVGPAVGSKALTLVGAIIIAGIFEAAGALIAGGDVVPSIYTKICLVIKVIQTLIFAKNIIKFAIGSARFSEVFLKCKMIRSSLEPFYLHLKQ